MYNLIVFAHSYDNLCLVPRLLAETCSFGACLLLVGPGSWGLIGITSLPSLK